MSKDEGVLMFLTKQDWVCAALIAVSAMFVTKRSSLRLECPCDSASQYFPRPGGQGVSAFLRVVHETCRMSTFSKQSCPKWASREYKCVECSSRNGTLEVSVKIGRRYIVCQQTRCEDEHFTNERHRLNAATAGLADALAIVTTMARAQSGTPTAAMEGVFSQLTSVVYFRHSVLDI